MAEETAPLGEDGRKLRYGWTTGACATAAAKAAYTALLTGVFPDPVAVTLGKGKRPAFALATELLGDGWARAGVIKDAGDDPDVTHGCMVMATVRQGAPGSGVSFQAGPGVGTVTKPGLPIPPGEPAINPSPRAMIRAAIAETASLCGGSGDAVVEIAIPDGEAIAARTWNPRLGIVGGLSILGTTGVVTPYSCSAWIHSIHRGVDVARATGLTHVVGSTGSTSEATARQIFGLPEHAYLDMGDFAGGLLKYLRRHPVARLTIAGGFAKLSKLADGKLDLHSGRSQVDPAALARRIEAMDGSADLIAKVQGANTALEALQLAQGAGIDLAGRIAHEARSAAISALQGAETAVEIVVVDRQGAVLTRTDRAD